MNKIILSGGGTGGSITPLLALAQELKTKGNYKFLWLGTRNGIEKEIIKKTDLDFKAIFSGKLRRYWDWRNLTDPFFIFLGFFQSFWILIQWRPHIILTAGSFVSVPVVWAAWILRIPVLAHQQDVYVGLANRLIAPFASIITVVLEKSLKDFKQKTILTGNPLRSEITKINKDLKTQALKYFQFDSKKPIILIMGGGTGAIGINLLIDASLEEILKIANVIWISGKNSIINLSRNGRDYQFISQRARLSIINSGLKIFEFIDSNEMAMAYQAADIVITRAGMGALSELAYLAKPIIIIPMPDSHQEANARYFQDKKAAIVLNQKELTPENLTQEIQTLLKDFKKQTTLSKNIKSTIKKDGKKEIAEIIEKLLISKN